MVFSGIPELRPPMLEDNIVLILKSVSILKQTGQGALIICLSNSTLERLMFYGYTPQSFMALVLNSND